MNDDTKNPFTSKTMIAAAVEVLLGVAVQVGWLTLTQAVEVQPFLIGLALWGLRTADVPLTSIIKIQK